MTEHTPPLSEEERQAQLVGIFAAWHDEQHTAAPADTTTELAED